MKKSNAYLVLLTTMFSCLTITAGSGPSNLSPHGSLIEADFARRDMEAREGAATAAALYPNAARIRSGQNHTPKSECITDHLLQQNRIRGKKNIIMQL